MNFDWAELAFASKKPLRELEAIFIATPRELSRARFIQIVKQYLPAGNIVVGLAKENFVGGFEGQPQFKTLQESTIAAVVKSVSAAKTPHKIATLHYFQRELNYILEKVAFKKVLLVNGSWQHAFHHSAPFYTLVKNHTAYEMISPFASEQEAKTYEAKVMKEIKKTIQIKPGTYSAKDMLTLAAQAAKWSFDYNFQTGVTLGRQTNGDNYKLLGWSFSKVVPYQTYAMHFGASREANLSPAHDLNHYDTVHAEVEAIVKAQKEGWDLRSTTLFINLLPCPTCARMFVETDIAEFVYRTDHSEGYAIKMLESAGKKVRRLA
jgi:deoxycytidylate deaminase